MRFLLTNIFMLVMVVSSLAQITIEPEEWLPCEEIKLIVDISSSDCDGLIGHEGPLYLWTWSPADPTVEGGNGQWGDSNEALKMTKEGTDLWSITMVPTEFYGVTADQVYERGFSLLVKADNGGEGGDCSKSGGEFKTSDFTLAVTPPFKSAKVFALPAAVFSYDVFTFVYDQSLETKASMQDATELYVYAAAISDGVEYAVSAMAEVGNNPNLRLNNDGNGQFSLSIIPDQFFTAVPDGQEIQQVMFVVRKKEMSSNADRADEDAIFDLGCEAASGGC